MQRGVAVLFALCLFCVAMVAQAQMDATMKRGETKTFTVPFSYTVQTFAVNSVLVVVINASPELTLGHTTLPGFNCTESPSVNICVGSMTAAGSQSITITQVLSVGSDASRPSGSWTIQLVGDGLSGLAPKIGVITIPDAGPQVVVTKLPEPVVTTTAGMTGFGGAVLTFSLKNVGNAPTTVLINVGEPFYFDDPKPITKSIGAGQEISVGVLVQTNSEGYFANAVVVTGEGVPPDTVLPVQLLVTKRPTGSPQTIPATYRKDIVGVLGGPNPTGSVTFTNNGPGAANGLVFSDVQWVTIPDPSLSLQAGESKAVTFTIDLVKKQHNLAATGGTGSLSGTLTFRYLVPGSNKTATTRVKPLADPPGTGSVSITLVSTVAPSASTATIPPLPAIHDQLFLAGVGHVQGSVGLFISDLTVYPQVMRGNSSFRSLALSDLDLYYTPLGGGTSRKATITAFGPPNVAALGDLVGTVYGTTQQVGSLQIRAPGYLAGEGAVGVNANVFNVSGKTGTFGTGIPVFKFGAFQCTQDLTKKLYLTGLLKNSSGHTNFYIQETCGGAAKVTLDFYDPSGTKIGSTTQDVAPFTAVQLPSTVMPNGAVSAILSHAAGSAGGFVAYATPVDEASGDTWAQVDWPNQRGYQGTAPVIIPVAGATPGANNTYFRTDLSIVNTGATAGAGTLRFYNRTGEIIDKTINLTPLQTQTYSDVTTNLFGVTTPHVGYLTFTPTSGSFVLTSRNYSTPVGSNATFGTAVPTLPLTSALTPTQPLRRIGGIEDASPDTIAAGRGATFRSNIGLIETTGQAVTVKVTVYYSFSSSLTSTVNGASATFNLNPNQFVLTGLGSTIFGANRANLGELHNVTVEFEIVGGTGKVLPFVSSVDNGSSDSTFRTE